MPACHISSGNQSKFQSLIGRLKILFEIPWVWLEALFQSLIGRLKIQLGDAQQGSVWGFNPL